MPISLQIDCLPVNEGEEVILKINGATEVPVFREKQPFVVTSKRKTISRYPKDNSNQGAVSYTAVICLLQVYT